MNNHETRRLGSGSIEQLKQLSFETEREFLSVQTEQEQFIHQINFLQNRQNSDINFIDECQRERYSLDSALKCKARFYELRKSLMRRYTTILSIGENLLQVLDNELSRWKWCQQFKGNEVLIKNKLEEIQEFCVVLSEVIWLTMAQMKQLMTMANNMPTLANQEDLRYVERLESLIKAMTSLFTHCMNSVFIIEEQPPQVVMKNSSFGATVRLMVSDKLTVHMSEPKMKIINESQALSMFKKHSVPIDETSGQFAIKTSAMVCNSASSHHSFHLKNIKIDKIKRKERKGMAFVTDEKVGIVFQCQVTVGEGELVIGVSALSVPIVVVVHINQKPKAWATITLDTAFATPGRQSFAVEDRVPFSRLADVLSDKFKSSVGMELNANHRRVLAEKMFRRNELINWSEEMTSCDLFNKTLLSESDITFSDWFYAILKFSEKYLRDLWEDGLVMGFVSRRQTEQMLSSSPIGTFLLKYSDSKLGAMTVAWVGKGDNGLRVHTWFGPFDENDINMKKVADIVKELHDLKHLYPGTPKDVVFAKHYTPVNNTSIIISPYVKPVFIMAIPGSLNAPFDTSQHNSHSSPSSSSGSMCIESTVTYTAMDVEIGSEDISEEDFDLLIQESMKFHVMSDSNHSLDFDDTDSLYGLFVDS